MEALARKANEHKSEPVTNVSRLDADTAWAAFMRRDRHWDGRVIGAVKTTGIYCKPSCPAKRPKREHVQFYATTEEARAAGFRPCLRWAYSPASIYRYPVAFRAGLWMRCSKIRFSGSRSGLLLGRTSA